MDLTGKSVDALPTPAMVVDIEALDANLALMAGYFAGRPCRLRPHFKSHKCVTLARRQLDAGSAAGVTCAKVSEAEALVAGGITDVLIANQVVGPDKAARLAALNRSATVRCAVDDAGNVAELDFAARAAGVVIGVLVEVDVGMGRCGVKPGAAAARLVAIIAEAEGLRFDGLQGYEGHVVTIPDPHERRRKVAAALGPLVDTRRALEKAGHAVTIVSAGGTGTYDMTGSLDGIDEVQAGSYALMDAAYAKVRPEFKVARTVLATVISARPGRCVLDVGVKGLGCEFGPPVVKKGISPISGGWQTPAGNPPARENASGGPEQGKLDLSPFSVAFVAEEHTAIDNLPARVGRKIHLIPSHGCTTAALYRQLWIARAGTIEACWPIEGAGALE